MKKAITAAVLTLLAFPALGAAPPPAPGPAGDCGAALVEEFLGAYRDAVLEQGPTGRTPSEVRALYLTPELNDRLDRWEGDNRADPVFRARTAPASWSTACAADRVDVTQRWRPGDTRYVRYTVRLADKSVVDLQDRAPRAAAR
ncbi:hypothetical protein [Kitasatospora sp. NPDC050543]|uniref:hypothetical protein n=1 Tax=Kitasatospora sp. NPDC050543 TaxID=3364054 RepID=UPI0037ABE0F0